MSNPANTIDKILSFVRVVGVRCCWRLRGHKLDKDGYATVRFDGKKRRAHRVIFEQLIGSIEEPTLDHLCRNRWCCNPNHVEPASIQVNTLRGSTLAADNAAKVVCLRGHSLEGGNLRITRDKKRVCRECHRQHARESRERAA